MLISDVIFYIAIKTLDIEYETTFPWKRFTNSIFLYHFTCEQHFFFCYDFHVEISLKQKISTIACLTHEAEWYINASVKQTNTASDNGLSPVCYRAIIWTNAAILSIRSKGTYFNEILFKTQKAYIQGNALEMLSAKWQPFCLPHCVNTLMAGNSRIWNEILFVMLVLCCYTPSHQHPLYWHNT